MQILWGSDCPLSVAEVLNVVRQQRQVAYTTVMTILDKMARKGSVRRSKKGKAYLYWPEVSRLRVLGCLLERFVDQYFGGNQSKLGDFMKGASSAELARGLTAVHSVGAIRAEDPLGGSREKEDIDVCLL